MAGSTRSQYSIPLMIAAFLVIGGFLYWMNVSTEAVRVAIAEEEEAAAAEREAEAEEAEPMPVDAETFSEAPENFVGQLVRIEEVPYFNEVGPEAFFVLLPNDLMYLVHMEGGYDLTQGDQTTVAGTVEMMTDSVLDAWVARGAMPDPSLRESAALSTSFIEAVEVRNAAAEPEGDDAEPGSQP